MMKQTTMEKAGNKFTLVFQSRRKVTTLRAHVKNTKKSNLRWTLFLPFFFFPFFVFGSFFAFVIPFFFQVFHLAAGFEHPYKTHAWFFKDFHTAIDEGWRR